MIDFEPSEDQRLMQESVAQFARSALAARGREFEKGRAGQARELRGAFGLLRSRSATWRVNRVYWFSFTDEPGSCNFCDGSGLFKQGGLVAKPSWSSYKRFAR